MNCARLRGGGLSLLIQVDAVVVLAHGPQLYGVARGLRDGRVNRPKIQTETLPTAYAKRVSEPLTASDHRKVLRRATLFAAIGKVRDRPTGDHRKGGVASCWVSEIKGPISLTDAARGAARSRCEILGPVGPGRK